MARYEAEIGLGPVYESTEVVLRTHDRELLAALEDAVRVTYDQWVHRFDKPLANDGDVGGP